jgi:uncharacterized protein (DUF1778 family)
MESVKKSRFEMRLTDEDKLLFEKASEIKGYSSLAGFVSAVMRKEAQEIIQEHERILVSNRDKEIFFEAILSNLEPNQKLKEAASRYKELTDQ